MPDGYGPINIYCSSCGAPAEFDIGRHIYGCRYCGAELGLQEPLKEKQGFRRLHRKNLKNARKQYKLCTCSCSGCGAAVVFPENEALTHCAFCGRNIARREYPQSESFPELIIPFKITPEEAKAKLLEWCQNNPLKKEARLLRRHADQLKGFYLPYELVKGPTECKVSREDSRSFSCRGYMEGIFINTSSQLDNYLLNGMEPYDLKGIREFDFSYLAGQCVKICDLDGAKTEQRVKDEIASDYEPILARVMETKAVKINPNVDNMLRMSVVLPAYYIRAENALAAVNGQTGKVAVREIKERFLPPWWIKPIAATAAVSLLCGAVTYIFSADLTAAKLVAGCMALFLLIVLFTAYDDKYGGSERHRLRRRILTSDNTREAIAPPEFYEELDGAVQPVVIRFTTFARVLKMLAIAFGTVFLPIIIAFVLNGFSLDGLQLSGAAVWLCITVPVAPVYLLKFGRLDLYEHPLIYVKKPDGRLQLYRSRKDYRKIWQTVKDLVLSPLAFVIGFMLFVLLINVYLILNPD